MRRIRFIFIAAVVYFLAPEFILGQENKVVRRVLVLDFVNQQKNEKADYLSGSIADALLEPLGKTRKFELLPRSQGDKILKRLQLKASDTFNEELAIQIGNEAQADVIVVGNFVAIEPNINIQARAIDVAEKRIAVSRSKVGKTDATIFDTINLLANDMSAEMAEKLPPLAQRVVYRDDSFFIARNIARNFQFHMVVPTGVTWGFESKYVGLGFGASVDTSFEFLNRHVQPYFSSGATFTRGKYQVDTMSAYHFAGGLSYGFKLPQKLWLIREMQVRPFATGGMAVGGISARGQQINYLVPGMAFGAVADFFVDAKWSFALNLQQQLLFDSETTLKIFSVGLGVGYRL